jgi:hypothetical protein
MVPPEKTAACRREHYTAMRGGRKGFCPQRSLDTRVPSGCDTSGRPHGIGQSAKGENDGSREGWTLPPRRPGGFANCATDYTTLAITSDGAGGAGWRGRLRFHNLPAGVFRVLAVRPGARWSLSEPVTLEIGKTATVRLSLPPEEPAGNILMNPDGGLAYLTADAPDRWQRAALPDKKVGTARAWTSAKVYAIGSPEGLTNTFSDGLVSGLRRDTEGLLIQTTAAISPGSSGGPLLDVYGRVLGVTSSMLAAPYAQNLNFAVSCESIWLLLSRATSQNRP